MQDVTAHDQFTRLAHELSHNGAMITNLLATHPAEGHCTGCRLPGDPVSRGRPGLFAGHPGHTIRAVG